MKRLAAVLLTLTLLTACSSAISVAIISTAGIGFETWVNSSAHFTSAQKATLTTATNQFIATIGTIPTTCSGKTGLTLANCVTPILSPALQSVVSTAGTMGLSSDIVAEIDGSLAAVQLAVNLWYTTIGAPPPAAVVPAATTTTARGAERDTAGVIVAEAERRHISEEYVILYSRATAQAEQGLR